jgi:hypothetical protein
LYVTSFGVSEQEGPEHFLKSRRRKSFIVLSVNDVKGIVLPYLQQKVCHDMARKKSYGPIIDAMHPSDKDETGNGREPPFHCISEFSLPDVTSHMDSDELYFSHGGFYQFHGELTRHVASMDDTCDILERFVVATAYSDSIVG